MLPAPPARRRPSWAPPLGVVAFGVLAFGAVLAGCGGSAPDVPAGPDGTPDAALEQGREIWAARCASCHGADGGGGRGKKLSDGAAADLHPDIDTMISVIADGKGRGMPAFGGTLSDAEIEAVARYVREVLD